MKHRGEENLSFVSFREKTIQFFKPLLWYSSSCISSRIADPVYFKVWIRIRFLTKVGAGLKIIQLYIFKYWETENKGCLYRSEPDPVFRESWFCVLFRVDFGIYFFFESRIRIRSFKKNRMRSPELLDMHCVLFGSCIDFKRCAYNKVCRFRY